jgi:hypothetical protein
MAAPRNSLWIKEYVVSDVLFVVVDDDDDTTAVLVFSVRTDDDSVVLESESGGSGVAVAEMNHGVCVCVSPLSRLVLGERMENESISVANREAAIAATMTTTNDDDDTMLNM